MSDWTKLPLAFVDLETTGAKAEIDRITEVGIVTLQGDTVSTWEQLVQPDTQISPFIEQLTGISNAMVANAPRFADIADEVKRRLDGHLFVAHNARFDFGFLRQEFARLGIEFRATVVCTVKLSRKLYPQHHKHSLDSLIARHGLQMESRHRALADARAVQQFWQIARREIDPETFAAAVKALLSPAALPPQLDPQDIEALPEQHGVYVAYDANRQALFVGKSHQLKKRVLAHLAADRKAGKAESLWTLATQISGIACAGEIGTLLTEARLMHTLRPRLNRQIRPGDDSCFWCLTEHAAAGPLELVNAADIDLESNATLYGPFQNRREARSRLNELIKLNGLCPAALGLEKILPQQACSARKLKHCKGTCTGDESLLAHAMRTTGVLSKLKLAPWPMTGPAMVREGDVVHVAAQWRYLGSARTEAEIADCLQAPIPAFDRETYRVLLKVSAALQPLPAGLSAPAS